MRPNDVIRRRPLFHLDMMVRYPPPDELYRLGAKGAAENILLQVQS
jgi:hypothetical protein